MRHPTPAASAAPLAALPLLALLACAGDAPPPPSGTGALLPAAALVSPARGGRFAQNDPTTGCPPHAERGHGFRLAFDWQDVEGAVAYVVEFRQRDAQFPAVSRVVTGSAYAQLACNAFVLDRNAEGWSWRVAALASLPDSLARPAVIWSEERAYGFEPCRLADGRACHAPAADTAATPGAGP